MTDISQRLSRVQPDKSLALHLAMLARIFSYSADTGKERVQVRSRAPAYLRKLFRLTPVRADATAARAFEELSELEQPAKTRLRQMLCDFSERLALDGGGVSTLFALPLWLDGGDGALPSTLGEPACIELVAALRRLHYVHASWDVRVAPMLAFAPAVSMSPALVAKLNATIASAGAAGHAKTLAGLLTAHCGSRTGGGHIAWLVGCVIVPALPEPLEGPVHWTDSALPLSLLAHRLQEPSPVTFDAESAELLRIDLTSALAEASSLDFSALLFSCLGVQCQALGAPSGWSGDLRTGLDAAREGRAYQQLKGFARGRAVSSLSLGLRAIDIDSRACVVDVGATGGLVLGDICWPGHEAEDESEAYAALSVFALKAGLRLNPAPSPA